MLNCYNFTKSTAYPQLKHQVFDNTIKLFTS